MSILYILFIPLFTYVLSTRISFLYLAFREKKGPGAIKVEVLFLSLTLFTVLFMVLVIESVFWPK
ncbi:hypothetical protein SAMN05421877_107107 [Sphingobacterium lactis]|uniref:Uncharacterized protein n=1 Tax=Sphingobacterium lactis TaxID=797291 RepID=A0A1H5ZQT8_9SPHI|nr:hypothetical protein SAMN05421877_107107 [Sphingobacterium lactis]